MSEQESVADPYEKLRRAEQLIYEVKEEWVRNPTWDGAAHDAGMLEGALTILSYGVGLGLSDAEQAALHTKRPEDRLLDALNDMNDINDITG